ncbi:uncharacterized protein BDW47DRAFT_118206 [Aspergillus candidus]|uniref:Serine-threonine/tyrosine-protein kinase catalytic domain-containing protein n=1 Tax=Aspergillus candidus TaxID=41067 RepID=A0A2I2F8Z4_ASPCN|nr:hypothetical protein BDW47DRAFT_118206 [Aspergillus candidus]PLB37104.1 hypothetical protein BDW47DRAFT_118206 [Aspergillus candidus]
MIWCLENQALCNHAIKIPLRHPWSSDSDVDINIKVIQHEQDVYRRLNLPGSVDGVQNNNKRVYRPVQIAWLRQMACVLEQIHERRILVADVATRKFLLDENMCLKLCDFSGATVLPLETICMEKVDDNGFSIQTDIGQLGAVMYEVITRQKSEIDLFRDNAPDDGRAAWPQRAELPNTDGLWLGWVMERCWTEGGFRNAGRLALALEFVGLDVPHYLNGV